MSRARVSLRSLAAAAATVVGLAGCTGTDAPGGATGGAPASMAGAGGSVAAAGGTGGSTSTGGTTSHGGMTGTGGNAGANQAAAGANNSAGLGGSAGSAGGTMSSAAGMGGGPSSGGDGGSPGRGGFTGAGGSTGGSSGASGANTSGGTSGTSALGGAGGAQGGSAGRAGAGGGASTCPPATPLTGGKQYCSNTKGNVAGNYAYELWASGSGSGCMTVYGVDATFSATWTGVSDFLARIGLGFDQTKTPAQIGTITATFAETKTGDTGLVYVGIYGWTVSPLREYYIIDDWGSTKPADTASDGTPRTHVGTITVDGDTYDVWKHTQTNKPAITGDNQTFDQYFSVRQNARQCGQISISEHFTQWTGLNLQLGKLEEAKLLVEAQDSTGKIDFTSATVVVK